MRVVILGPPGAGKGTQAELLSKELGVPKLSMGDILRKAVKEKTPLGEEAQRYMKEGKLVPDELILKLLEEKIEKVAEDAGFVLDGFPRNLRQAQILNNFLESRGKNLDWAIYLKVGEEEIVNRLRHRLICSKCGKVYRKDEIKQDRICEECGSQLAKRKDDDPHTIKERIKVYFEHTFPLVKYYQKKGILKEVEGEGKEEEVYERIRKALNLSQPLT